MCIMNETIKASSLTLFPLQFIKKKKKTANSSIGLSAFTVNLLKLQIEIVLTFSLKPPLKN